MKNGTAIAAVALRIALGWFMFFAGIEKVLDPAWTSKGFLLSAKTFPALYAWFAEPFNIWWVDPLNSWGITLIGVALLLGIGIRPAAWAGVGLMILYYFPQNIFPTVPHGYIIEEHVIYAVAFALVGLFPTAHQFGLHTLLRKTFFGRIPLVKSLI